MTLWVILVSIASGLVSTVAAVVFLVRLPAGAFAERQTHWPRSFSRRFLRVGMNVIGWILILVGVVLSVPGIPGQGILTILMGLLLVDFPGRWRLLQKLLTRPLLQRGVDRIRVRFGKSPFTW